MANVRNPLPNSTDKVSFKNWFLKAVEKDMRLKQHHYDALLVYFKSMGMTEFEPISKFDKGLSLYFGK